MYSFKSFMKHILKEKTTKIALGFCILIVILVFTSKLINVRHNETVNKESISFDKNKYSGAIFYSPHQDDETIFYGQVIADAVHNFGADNVHVVMVSDGSKSGAIDYHEISSQLDDVIKEAEKEYTKSGENTLSDKEKSELKVKLFSKARNNESVAALKSLGIKGKNIEFLDYPDGILNHYVPQISAKVKEFCDKGKYIHFSYTPYFDTHQDHRAVGEALKNMAKEVSDNDFLFIVKFVPECKDSFEAEEKKHDDKHRLIINRQYKEALNNAYADFFVINNDAEKFGVALARYANENKVDLSTAVKACEELDNLRLGIGPQSVSEYFSSFYDKVNSDDMVTMLHTPFEKK